MTPDHDKHGNTAEFAVRLFRAYLLGTYQAPDAIVTDPVAHRDGSWESYFQISGVGHGALELHENDKGPWVNEVSEMATAAWKERLGL